MRKNLLAAAAMLIASLTLTAQTLDTSLKPMTRQRAEMLLQHVVITGPVKSLIPEEHSGALDTLETGNPEVRIVLFADNTWKYIKNSDILETQKYFNENWNDYPDAYRIDYNALPERTTLWLVDDNSQYCCPNPVAVYSKFGYRHRRRHQGVDLPLKTGDPVRVAFDGKVRVSKYYRGYGNLVIVRHANGLETFYGHLSERDVQVNDWVHAGQVIGKGGSTGRSSGPHLHFETRYKGYAFDPEWLIKFPEGNLRSGTFTLKRKYLNPASHYVPTSDDEEEEILLAEQEDRAQAAKKAAEQAAVQYYTIRKGDTLGKIASKYHTTVSKLCKLNNITPKTTLRIGRRLRVR